MTEMNVSLPDHLRKFVEAQAAEGGHASPGEYLLAVLEDARKRKAKENLFAKLDEAMNEKEPPTLMTREDWDAIEREAIDGLRGEPIEP